LTKLLRWIIEIDIEMPFDCADWNFLALVMEKKGIRSRWISWIMGCICNTRFSIFLSNHPGGRLGHLKV
ncbi:MAG: hypothetical protein Q8847_02685, partial [Sweet potato little leaf phytoplasma]|nr:hypothetical protein [Sweet potato little leaf phytoplasma]